MEYEIFGFLLLHTVWQEFFTRQKKHAADKNQKYIYDALGKSTQKHPYK